MDAPNLWPTRVTCFRPAIFSPWNRSRRSSQIGVAALKIEGRYKDADYVALTTRAYRKAVDEAWAGRPQPVTPGQRLATGASVFARPGSVFHDRDESSGGGQRARAAPSRRLDGARWNDRTPNNVFIEPSEAHRIAPLKPGDGVVFDAADWRSPEETEEGGRIYQVRPGPNGLLELRFGNSEIRFERIRPGDRIWRTDDPDLDRAARAYTQAAAPVSRQPVRVRVVAIEGEPLGDRMVAGRPAANRSGREVRERSRVPRKIAAFRSSHCANSSVAWEIRLTNLRT